MDVIIDETAQTNRFRVGIRATRIFGIPRFLLSRKCSLGLGIT